MLKIALTGPSGSGKGYLSSILEEKGIACLDCDKVVHEIYKDPAFARMLSDIFMTDLGAPDGGVDRAKLRNLVFGNGEHMEKLSKLIYPLVRQSCLAFLKERESLGALAAAVDAPQLFEAGFEEDYDLILAVTAPVELRIRRIMKRDGITEERALERIAHQMTEKEYAARSHALLVNDEKENLEEALLRVLCSYGVKL